MTGSPTYGPWLPPVAGPPDGPAPAAPPAPGGAAPGWAPWTAWVALIVAFAFAVMGAIVVGVVGAIFGASFEDPPPAVNIAATFVQDGAFVAAALLFAGRAGRVLPSQFGLVRTRVWPAVGWAVLAYVGYGLLSRVWALVIDAKAKDELPTSLGADESTVALVAVCVLVTVVAPIAEEAFFRGYFFGALRNWRGPWPAAVVTGLVFGAIHVGSSEAVFLLPLAILGFALCVVRMRTGSLLPCIALHAANNALAFGVVEEWTAGQTLLLGVGAVSVTLLACLAAMRAWTARPDARPLI